MYQSVINTKLSPYEITNEIENEIFGIFGTAIYFSSYKTILKNNLFH